MAERNKQTIEQLLSDTLTEKNDNYEQSLSQAKSKIRKQLRGDNHPVARKWPRLAWWYLLPFASLAAISLVFIMTVSPSSNGPHQEIDQALSEIDATLQQIKQDKYLTELEDQLPPEESF